MNWWDIAFWGAILAGAVQLATPIALAAIGETIVERGGNINIGIDGIMSIGAFAAIYVESIGGGWELALIAALVVGMVVGLAIALAVLRGGANQIIIGIAASLVGTGVAVFCYQLWDASDLAHQILPLVPTLSIPLVRDIPVLGKALSGQSVLTYGAAILTLAMVFVLKRTKIGLLLKAVGDQPEAAAARGVDVIRIRTVALMIGGALAGLGGAAITAGYLGTYTDGVTAGRGYVALAIVITGRWSPVGAAAGALLFAFFDSLALAAQNGAAFFPVEAYMALPYLVTLLVLVMTARGNVAPRALGLHFEHDQ
jgi:general nucleoside transport system permease protein